jgi:CyaY protein
MADVLSEARFDSLADQTLSRMVEALADLEEDTLDVELESGVLTLSFDDGTRYVVNSHRAARQIWMAADSTAWHFDYEEGQWRAKKSGDELWSTLADRTGRKLGRPIQLP